MSAPLLSEVPLIGGLPFAPNDEQRRSPMQLRWLVVVGFLTTSLSGCAYSIKASSNYDGRVNFSKYDTFFMMKGNSTGDSVWDERLTSEVKSTLMSKGWVELPEGDGQTAVIVHVATSAEHTDESFYNGWGDGWHWRWDAPGSTTRFVEDYKVGSVVVTIFDANTKQAIWRGFATDAVSANPKHAVKMREAAVAKIFAQFPPAQ
jgi:hypothetical protein